MSTTSDLTGDQRMRLANQYETFLRSMMLLRGDSLSSDQLGQIVDRAVASASPEERRNPVPSPDAINRLQQFLIQTTEAGRPRNDFSAEAARAAQAAGADGTRGSVGFGYIDAIRAGSSARYRELSGSDGKAGSGTSSTGNPVTPEFARSFAGTGMVGGTLRTFAAVGLDRDTFNEFRREGFSKAQIVESAQDTKALGWKGKEDLSIAQHASPEARKAVIAVEQAKTPEQLAEAQAKEAEVARKTEALPDSDPRKEGTKQFFKHVIKKSQNAERHKALGAGAQEHDSAVAKDHAGEKPSRAEPDALMAKGGERVTKNATVATTRIASGFEVESETPAPAKPATVKIAAAKPATPGQG